MIAVARGKILKARLEVASAEALPLAIAQFTMHAHRGRALARGPRVPCDTASRPGLVLHFHHHGVYQRRQPTRQ
jgi:hypothetical protein